MKLWRENKVRNEYELSNVEIARRFIVEYDVDLRKEIGLGRALCDFISSKTGLNSVWEWEQSKGSIDGSKDMLEILRMIDEKLVANK